MKKITSAIVDGREIQKGTVKWNNLYHICSALIRYASKADSYNADVLYDIEGFVDILNGKREMPPHYYIGIREAGTDSNSFINAREADYPYLARLEVTTKPYFDDLEVTLWEVDQFEREPENGQS